MNGFRVFAMYLNMGVACTEANDSVHKKRLWFGCWRWAVGVCESRKNNERPRQTSQAWWWNGKTSMAQRSQQKDSSRADGRVHANSNESRYKTHNTMRVDITNAILNEHDSLGSNIGVDCSWKSRVFFLPLLTLSFLHFPQQFHISCAHEHHHQAE